MGEEGIRGLENTSGASMQFFVGSRFKNTIGNLIVSS